jgi:hypothetical protein
MSAMLLAARRQLWAINAVTQVVPIKVRVLTSVADLLRHVINGAVVEETILTVEKPHVRVLVHVACRWRGGFPLAHDALDALPMDPIMPTPVAVQGDASFMRAEIVVVQTVIRNAHCIGIIPSTAIFPSPCAKGVHVWALFAKGANVHAGATLDIHDGLVVVTGMDACKFATV